MASSEDKTAIEMLSPDSSTLLLRKNLMTRGPLLGGLDSTSDKLRYISLVMGMPLSLVPFFLLQDPGFLMLAPGIALFLGANSLISVGRRVEEGNKFLNYDNQMKFRQGMPVLKKSEERHLVEEYFINHPREFHGFVLKNSESEEKVATHHVKTYLIRGKGKKMQIEQQITEVPGYKWDKTMDSIDTLMAEPKPKPTVTMQNNMVSRITINPFITSNR